MEILFENAFLLLFLLLCLGMHFFMHRRGHGHHRGPDEAGSHHEPKAATEVAERNAVSGPPKAS